jgi:hypothetical protein
MANRIEDLRMEVDPGGPRNAGNTAKQGQDK